MSNKKPSFITLLVAVGLFAISNHVCADDVDISNFDITSNSVAFDISGVFPTAPADLTNGLLFVNPDAFADPGFALGDFVVAASESFTGSQQLRFTVFDPVATGGEALGDYFFVAFEDPFSSGEAISGAFTATWDQDVFDLSQVSSLEVFWGAADDQTINSGVLLDTVQIVTEPNAMLVLCLSAVGFLSTRRRS